MRRFLPVLILATAAWPAHAQTSAQTAPPSVQTPAQTKPAAYRVAGTAVSSIDNHPIQRATIQLLDSLGQKIFDSTTSDEFGRFVFTGVPAGNHELQGFGPGYLPSAYDEHEGFNTGIITGVAGVDTESLVLKLRPEGTITGAIRDESAEPVDNAMVHLFRRNHDYGDSRVVSAGILNTDDLGHFEFRHLLPGSYYLAVTAAPWYAVHPDSQPAADNAAAAIRQRGASNVADSIDPMLDVAYPATFYPGTTDPAATSPILIRGGDTVDLTFQLFPKPAFTLTLPRRPAVRGQQQGFTTITASFLGQALTAMGNTRQTPMETVVSGLAPGDYSIFSNSGGGSPWAQTSGAPSIHITDHSVTASLDPGFGAAHVHLRLQSADGGGPPPDLSVGLVRRGSPFENFAAQRVNNKAQTDLDVAPGDYYLSVEGPQRRYFVRRILDAPDTASDASVRPLPSNDLHVAADEKRSLTVIFSAGAHTLRGVARKDGRPQPGAFLLLVPTGELHEIRTAFRQQSDLDGSFEIPGLDPGAYTLVAIDNGWDLDWQQDAVLSRYLPKAIPIQIPDSPNHTHELRDPVLVQLK